MSTTASVVPIEPHGEPPQIIAPDAQTIFALRAQRFETLAEGHSLGDWLRFLAAITRAQHQALQALPALALPDAGEQERAHQHHMPLLPVQTWPRDPLWHLSLRQIAAAIAEFAPEPARQDLARLSTYGSERLEALAERVLLSEYSGEDLALLPYVGAALQVLWTAGASRLGADAIAALDVPGVCPCCGFLPVASVVRLGGDVDNMRYLHCALCNCEWNLVRVKCSSCDATEGIAYCHLEAEGLVEAAAVRAETCDSCKSYLKICYSEKSVADPVADDLASLALDILVDEAGYSRSGPNLLLVPNSPETMT